VVQTENKQLK